MTERMPHLEYNTTTKNFKAEVMIFGHLTGTLIIPPSGYLCKNSYPVEADKLAKFNLLFLLEARPKSIRKHLKLVK